MCTHTHTHTYLFHVTRHGIDNRENYDYKFSPARGSRSCARGTGGDQRYHEPLTGSFAPSQDFYTYKPVYLGLDVSLLHPSPVNPFLFFPKNAAKLAR